MIPRNIIRRHYPGKEKEKRVETLFNAWSDVHPDPGSYASEFRKACGNNAQLGIPFEIINHAAVVAAGVDDARCKLHYNWSELEYHEPLAGKCVEADLFVSGDTHDWAVHSKVSMRERWAQADRTAILVDRFYEFHDRAVKHFLVFLNAEGNAGKVDIDDPERCLATLNNTTPKMFSKNHMVVAARVRGSYQDMLSEIAADCCNGSVSPEGMPRSRPQVALFS